MTTKTDAFSRLLLTMDELREKCPWDKKQTMESLRYLTIEELYELSDAILDKDILRKNKYFKIQQRIEAGKKTNLKLKNGYVARIFTGAKMPSNSRTVIMQENVNVNKNQICINKIPSKGQYIIMMNHSSFADVFFSVQPLMGKYTAVLASFNFIIPI